MNRAAWWKIARLELALAARDRSSLLWSLAAPVAMAWIMGTMFTSPPPAPTQVSLESGANPPVVRAVYTAHLSAHDIVVGDGGIRVVVPDSVLDRIGDGRAVDVRVLQGKASDTRARAVAARVREATYRLAFRAPELRRAAADTTVDAAALVVDRGPLAMRVETLGSAPKEAGDKERMLTAMLVMFIMFQVMTFFLQLWVEDLATGKMKRIVMSPVRTGDILAGQLAARLAWAGLQVVVILGVGSLVTGVRLDVPRADFLLVLLAFMLAASSIGMMLASFFRSSEKAGAIGVMASLVMAALGGCWWPLEIVPGPMRAVALVLPTGQANDAIGEMLALGNAAPFPAANLLALLAMAAIALPVAVRRMRSQLVG